MPTTDTILADQSAVNRYSPEQIQKMADAIFGKFGVISGLKIIEKCLSEAIKADPADAPFPLVGESAKLWHSAQREAYRHVLEMICVSQDVQEIQPVTV